MTLFRGMKRDGTRPLVSGGASGLDIRRGQDVEAVNDSDIVGPGSGGLSTAPDQPLLLARHRRPESLGGTSNHPVWAIEREAFARFRLRAIRDRPDHETVEAQQEMPLSDFIAEIHSTVSEWEVAYE